MDWYEKLQADVDRLKEQVHQTFPTADTGMIQHAYEFAAEAHKEQVRKTGEPYVAHTLATAMILADLRIDPPVIVAGLLHDTVEDTTVTLDDITREFGREVAQLVDGVTKLSQINQRTGHRDRKLASNEAESLRKMFLATADDVRVVLVKLADRLHNMQTLHGHKREKQIRIARETLDIYAPLANRLGIWQIKWQLEDLCLRYLEPDVYQSLVTRLNERRPDRERYLEDVKAQLRGALEEQGIHAEISGRPKHLYSIYRKMKRKERDLDQIYDVRAVRVLVESLRDCYAALGIVHSIWRPIPGEFDDYIANPKENKYQSLHTAVVGPQGKSVEVQIRTHEMHCFAEYGVAAHWRYKEQIKPDRFMDEKIKWLRGLLELRQEVEHEEDAEAFMEGVRSDVLPDHVLVFTPKGDIVELPAGSTPVDFAYYIHTEVGHRCRGAKVNGQIVPLDYILTAGEQVEIITAKRGGPSRDWLNTHLGYVNTSRARAKIRTWFRHQDREVNIIQGRELLDSELRKLGLAAESYERLCKEFSHYEKVDDFLAAIGAGDLSPQAVATKALEWQRQEEAEAQLEADLAEAAKAPQEPTEANTLIRGVGGMLTRVAECCHPLPGEDIVGYITKGHGITIHRRDCKNILSKSENERLITVDWSDGQRTTYPVMIQVRAFDRGGLLRDIVDIVAKEDVNMRAAQAVTRKKDHSAIITATLEISDASQLSRILNRIERLPNVLEAYRQTS